MDFGLSQPIGRNPNLHNILDLVLSNHYQLIYRTSVEPVKISDRNLIKIMTRIPIDQQETSSKAQHCGLSGFCFQSQHWAQINTEMLNRQLFNLVKEKETSRDALVCLLTSVETIWVDLGIPRKGGQSSVLSSSPDPLATELPASLHTPFPTSTQKELQYPPR